LDSATNLHNLTIIQWKALAKFIVDFLDAVRINKEGPHNKISLVGHSLGGFIAALVLHDLKEK
jgi:alpha-beta hydrolase superfamily lysophospholipase